MRQKPVVSIVVVNYNGRHLLEECLGSLAAQTYGGCDIVVVDNGSVDGSKEFIRERFPHARLVENTANAGYAVAANQGIAASRGEFVAVLNNDTKVDTEWIARLIAVADSDPRIGICASKQLNFFAPDTIDSAGIEFYRGGYPRDRGRYEKDTGQFNERRDMFGAAGASALYRRAMLDEVGLFDGDYFAYCEETDLCFRSHLYGWRCVYVPDAVVYHMSGQTRAREDKRFLAYYSERNRLFTIIKNYPLQFFFRYLPYLLKYEFDIALRLIRHGEKEVLAARLDALRLLPRMLAKRSFIQSHRRTGVNGLYALISREAGNVKTDRRENR